MSKSELPWPKKGDKLFAATNKQAAALRTKMERLFDDNPGLAVAVASQVMLKHLSDGSEQ